MVGDERALYLAGRAPQRLERPSKAGWRTTGRPPITCGLLLINTLFGADEVLSSAELRAEAKALAEMSGFDRVLLLREGELDERRLIDLG